MRQVANQFRRIFSDHGKGDKNFDEHETKLREAQRNLDAAIDAVTRASEILAGLIHSKSSLH